ncbi:MAG: ORF6N domain-containing protein [Elusimicrobiota bacterium]
MKEVITTSQIEQRIFLIRGQKVMLDSHLAVLYNVATKNLNKAVKRNIDRFPSDLMFRLTAAEYNSLRFQIGTLKRGQHSKYTPLVFTEQGVAMLSSVLRSKRAAQVNIAIMRAFVRLRELLSTHKDLARRLDELEGRYDSQFKMVFDAIREMMDKPEPSKKRIGLTAKERRAKYAKK